MKVIVYSLKDFEKPFLLNANQGRHDLTLTEEMLNLQTVHKAEGHEAIAVFSGDDVSAGVITQLHRLGVRYISVRAVGYDNVDISTATSLGMKCANVPEYSPNAIAEHAVAMMLCLNRKIILANQQVHEHNFTVGKLVGFDLNGKTVGIIGTGRIGSIVARILYGFGCRLLGYDIAPDPSLSEKYNLRYVTLDELCSAADIISINTPLNAATKYMINKDKIDLMKTGVMLINTGRGAVIHTRHVIEALQTGRIGALGIDVYEKEKGLFFYDYSASKVQDEMLEQLLQFPNVLITPHQAFATQEALANIAGTTLYNIDCWAKGNASENELPEKETGGGTYVPFPPIEVEVRRLKKQVPLK